MSNFKLLRTTLIRGRFVFTLLLYLSTKRLGSKFQKCASASESFNARLIFQSQILMLAKAQTQLISDSQNLVPRN